MDGAVLSGMNDVLIFDFPLVVSEEMLVGDGTDVGMTWGFDGGTDEVEFMSFGVNGKETGKFLGLV